MQSTIIKLFDYTNTDIPPEECQWHVTEEEIHQALETLAKKHSVVQEMAQVQTGDAVICDCLSGGDPDYTVLIYPGRILPGAEEAESGCIGRAVGESFVCHLGKTQVTLRVQKILRLLCHPIDDALVLLEKLPGVDTLAAFRAWYTQEAGVQKQTVAKRNIRKRLLQAILAGSEFSIMEEEQDRWCREMAQETFHIMIQNGQDPHIPEDGTALLTDEEALERICQDYVPVFREHIVYRYLANQNGYICTPDEQRQSQERFRAECAAQGRPLAESPKFESFTLYEYSAYIDHGTDILTAAAENYLED